MSGGFNNNAYQALKEQVSQLKNQQKAAAKNIDFSSEKGALSVLRLQQQYEEQLAGSKGEVARLQQQLADRTERSAKLRVQLDREKKALGQQQDKLGKVVKEMREQHEEELSRIKSRHAADMEDLRQQLAAQAVLHEEDKKRLEEEKQAVARELDEWCEAEMEAVKIKSMEAVKASREQADAWKKRFEQQRDKHYAALQDLEQANVLVKELQDSNSKLQQRVADLEEQVQREASDKLQLKDQCETEKQLTQEQLKVAHLEHLAELQNHKSKRVQEMEQIQQKLTQIITKKDAIINALKVELEASQAKQHEVEQLLQNELLGCDQN